MNKGTVLALLVVVLGGGIGIGKMLVKDKGGSATASSKTTAAALKNEPQGPSDGVDRVRVPLEGASKGPANAKVNIVTFSDFQCPFCSRVVPTLAQIEKEYGKQVRVFFRHNPLPFHQDAPLASEAAIAAEQQGKFWEMHDKLFANQQALKRPDLEKYAGEIGLDVGKFKAALDSGAGKARIQTDMALAKQVGANGTPNFYIDGRNLVGAQPFEEFKKVIDDEIARADKLIAKGTAPGQVYAAFMKGAKASPAAPAADKPQQPQKPPSASTEVYKVALTDAPTKGAKQPKVTIIAFSEFQCPFCSRVNPTLEQLVKDYGNDVAVSFRHNPLPFHNNAMIAAMASEAAREQGKFWQMHDKLFANQQALDRPNLEKYAQEIGLDMGKFKAALDKEKGKERIKRDMDDAAKFGARGTPNFFINGRNFRGAQPLEAFKGVVDEEIKKADAKLASGTSRAQLYAALTKDGLDKAAAPPPPPGQPDDKTRFKADIKGAPIKGAKDALVTIVQFSDFQCPFCSRVEPTMDKVLEEYKGKVRVAWRDLPLPFHPNAMPAAIAARAAGDQGKFWEMHKKLFADQAHLDRETYEKYASELGLNMGKFKAALDAQKGKEAIEADAAAGNKIGARGTPAFFINGKFLSGAQPFESFKAKIDEELKTAEGLIAKGTPKGHVYEALLKDAKSDVPAAPAAAPAGGGEKGPEQDTTVYKVAAGNSASKGPKSAPLEVIVFSDFQCPFCSRVEPSLTQLEKEFAGKVRVVWKNYPLPFHNNAEPAAQAAMAAHAQGKFWQMHDKLFANQQALDRAALEKYAQEVGLNMAKFKADLDASKYKQTIEAETKEGQAVGVNGTPAVFINGRKISGAYPFETFKKIADEELAKKTGKKRG
jgi:protein-disulfide isomerase